MINLDISSAAFYKSGSLIKLCLEYLGRSPESDPTSVLTATRFDPRVKRDLLKFIRNLKVRTRRNGTETQERGIKDLSDKGADALMFKKDDGGLTSVQVGSLLPSGRDPKLTTPFSSRRTSARRPADSCAIPGLSVCR